MSHYGCYVRIGDDLEQEKVSQEVKEANMAQAVKITQLLGTKICRIWAGNKDSELLGEDDWKKMVSDGKKFCALAEDAGITLAIEMHGNSVTNKAAAAVELDRAGGQPVPEAQLPDPQQQRRPLRAGENGGATRGDVPRAELA